MCSTHLRKHRARAFIKEAAVAVLPSVNLMAFFGECQCPLFITPTKQMPPRQKAFLSLDGEGAISAGILGVCF